MKGRCPPMRFLLRPRPWLHAGADEINLADTTGMGNPRQVRSLVQGIGQRFPGTEVSLHLHDTRGLGLANMFAGYEEGVRVFDVCAGGLGGCPFVKGAAGNVPTEDAVNMFESMGIETGIDLEGDDQGRRRAGAPAGSPASGADDQGAQGPVTL